MSMLDSFFNKGFKAAKCKTLLKLTIPRIKLLRNRREVQIKQMRRDIAKLLETGQEATARIRVEHIIREENMMAAQEIIELFCELITVRLPIIEAQRECPLDLKEAISSVCFAAPRCADLPELLQVQMLFASKYGKEFVSAATELMPECGVNRQLIELLSVRAPSPELKLKLLKEIAEEHELDWDSAASESEFLKPHEDLLNGPTQFVSGSKLPLPKEKHDESLNYASHGGHNEQPDSDTDDNSLDFPDVPKGPLRPVIDATLASDLAPSPSVPAAPHVNAYHASSDHSATSEDPSIKTHLECENSIEEKSTVIKDEVPNVILGAKEEKQFVPFISPPPMSSTTLSEGPSSTPPSISRKKSDANVDLQDVLAAAQTAAETAECAAATARTAATLAQARISELTKKNSEKFIENPFYTDIPNQPTTPGNAHFDHQRSFGDSDGILIHSDSHQAHEEHEASDCHPGSHQAQVYHQASGLHELPSFNKIEVEYDSPSSDRKPQKGSACHQPQRSASMDDDLYFSYPSLFMRQNSNLGSSSQFHIDGSHSTH
uniref:IST1-like protein n=1 Tax=Rhizophora mucronata TaxID=61149 RepID=A0A2P2LUU9_RHIMU